MTPKPAARPSPEVVVDVGAAEVKRAHMRVDGARHGGSAAPAAHVPGSGLGVVTVGGAEPGLACGDGGRRPAPQAPRARAASPPGRAAPGAGARGGSPGAPRPPPAAPMVTSGMATPKDSSRQIHGTSAPGGRMPLPSTWAL